ncbi:spore coat protein U domain-containing protein [Neisseria sicca]|uniref:spore coat protein U domain-containing protein n=1 Tax=Neisseria sicca TaxID=490 RepID=UPI00195BDC7C|nr:spore coat protein U domain-containing protein [Neisseria sicca]VTX84471.1 Spore Coat Protein U domain protein [Neisseria sicca]
MKTRFTLTSLALASLMMMGNTAMAETTKDGFFNVHLKLTGTCEVMTTSTGLNGAKITAENPSLAGADIDFDTHVASANAAAITKNNVGGIGTGLNISCSKNTPFTVALEPQNVPTSNGKGTMKGLITGNNDVIAYELFQPQVTRGTSAIDFTVAETITQTPWGTGSNALSLAGKGLASGEAIKLPVFATVPSNELNKFVDTYQDQVKVTLTY